LIKLISEIETSEDYPLYTYMYAFSPQNYKPWGHEWYSILNISSSAPFYFRVSDCT